jgi:cell division protein FtsB
MYQPRRVRYLTLFLVLAIIGVAFIIGNHQLQTSTKDMAIKESQAHIRIADLQREKLRMAAELNISGTDAYIENQARTLYGYLKPGELRFVITNPEALFQSGEGTPKLQVAQEGDKP